MVRGGKRDGAGRPQGSGKYREKTKVIRLPENEIESILQYVQNKFYRLPFYQERVAAGFPSPADGDVEDRLDLNELLIRHPSATFFLKVSGFSMVRAGIHHDDILIVDRSLEPIHGKIVIASVNGELTVKRLHCTAKKVQLIAENDGYPPIDITEDVDFHIWGVVTNVIHSC